MARKYREYGGEQSYIPAGIFKIRLPFIHYKWSWPECFQALLMCATCLSAIPVLTDVLGVDYELALSMVIINGFGYCLHILLGDPVVPGWITPCIPLTIAFLSQYEIGPIRTQHLIALQILVGVIFLVMGVTGAAKKLIHVFPNSLKGGILLGAGIAAVIGEFKVGARLETYPISITVGALVAYFTLFSPTFRQMRKESKFIGAVGKFGMLPAIIVAVILGPLVGELPWFTIEIGSVIKIPEFGRLIQEVSPFGPVGWPAASVFIAALPMAFVAYIIAFGDFVTSEELLKEADEIRQDEKIDFNASRSNIVSAIRNFMMAFIAPYTQLCGPLWAAVTAAISQRYKDGPEEMESIHSGMGTFRITTFIAVALIPISSLLASVLPVALSLTILVQGYICTRLAMDICRTEKDKGIAGVMGAVLATRGAAWGLAVGIIIALLLKDPKSKKNAEPAK